MGVKIDFEIRSITAADAALIPHIAKLHHLTHAQSFQAFAPRSWTDSRKMDEYLAYWSTILGSQGLRERTWVALTDGQVAGTVTIQNLTTCSTIFRPAKMNGVPETDIACLRLMYVHPDHLRQGMGSALYREASRFCLEKGYRAGSLITHAANARARRFYQSHHWQLDEIFQGQVKEFFREPRTMQSRARYLRGFPDAAQFN